MSARQEYESKNYSKFLTAIKNVTKLFTICPHYKTCPSYTECLICDSECETCGIYKRIERGV